MSENKPNLYLLDAPDLRAGDAPDHSRNNLAAMFAPQNASQRAENGAIMLAKAGVAVAALAFFAALGQSIFLPGFGGPGTRLLTLAVAWLALALNLCTLLSRVRREPRGGAENTPGGGAAFARSAAGKGKPA